MVKNIELIRNWLLKVIEVLKIIQETLFVKDGGSGDGD